MHSSSACCVRLAYQVAMSHIVCSLEIFDNLIFIHCSRHCQQTHDADIHSFSLRSSDENEYLKFKYVMRGARPRYPVGMVTRDEKYDAAEPSER
jgi:hypothetical protein